jgi:hypothetical protein
LRALKESFRLIKEPCPKRRSDPSIPPFGQTFVVKK